MLRNVTFGEGGREGAPAIIHSLAENSIKYIMFQYINTNHILPTEFSLKLNSALGSI